MTYSVWSSSQIDRQYSYTLFLGLEDQTRRFAGVLNDTLTLESSVRDVQLTSSFGVLGSQETKQAISTPTYSTLEPFTWAEAGTVTLNAVDKKAQLQALSVTFNNNIPHELTYGHGARTMARKAKGRFEITGTVDLAWDDWAQYDLMVAGTEFAIQVIWTQDANHVLTLDLPECVYLSDTAPHQDRWEELTLTCPFRVVGPSDFDVTSGPRLTLKNTVYAYPDNIT